jgi:hypothetical protein
MSNTTLFVSIVLTAALILALVVGYYTIVAIDKKKATAKIAAKAASDLATMHQANLQGWQDMNEVIRVITTDLHWLAREAGLRDLHAAINAKSITNMRLGQVASSNMCNHDGLGLYMTMDGQEVAFGIKQDYTNKVSLFSGVCRIYGE